TPGPWTFILEATREAPRRVSHPSRKTIGIRVPHNAITLELLEQAGSQLISTTLIPEGEAHPLNDANDIIERFGNHLAAVIDVGACALVYTSELTVGRPQSEVLRAGRGDPAALGME